MPTSTMPDFTLDLRGESCPFPVVHTLEALEGMQKGQVLHVVTDCPSSFRNIPEEALRRGYEFAEPPRQNGQEYLFCIVA